MIEILHYLQDPKLWELWYLPYYGQCRIYIINRSITATITRISNDEDYQDDYSNVGALIIRIGYWGILYYNYHKEPLKIV